MAQMAEGEWRGFVSEGTRTAKIATVRTDGRPHVVPIWFVLDGDDLIFTTGENSVKAQALRRDARVALCVDDQAPPYAYVMIECTTRMQIDAPEMLRWTTRIGARYMGAARAEEFGRRNVGPSELLVRVTPTRVNAEKDIAGYA
ncbi:MAG TPA: PPOX class F420-dependent oxidoreductase [Ktedonobacterales bacterium]|nr:PPOX class F420-dependent oxidoreductase [Ktedonobacterales bacterium]